MITTLKVTLVRGLYCEEDWTANIELDEASTLAELHDAIQMAVGFDNDHSFSFFLSRTDRSRTREYFNDDDESIDTKTVKEMFPLPEKQSWFYLFDWGDEWVFKISKTRKASSQPCLELSIREWKVNRESSLFSIPPTTTKARNDTLFYMGLLQEPPIALPLSSLCQKQSCEQFGRRLKENLSLFSRLPAKLTSPSDHPQQFQQQSGRDGVRQSAKGRHSEAIQIERFGNEKTLVSQGISEKNQGLGAMRALGIEPRNQGLKVPRGTNENIGSNEVGGAPGSAVGIGGLTKLSDPQRKNHVSNGRDRLRSK